MTSADDLALMAHLMRRAGFGANREEMEASAARGYDAALEELLHPEQQPAHRWSARSSKDPAKED